MDGQYDVPLVMLSVIVAVVSSYTALELARRVSDASGLAARVWLLSGAISMGIGIWTMHFVGMLAFSLDMPFSFDIPTTVYSLFVGIGASAFAIHVGSKRDVGIAEIGFSGCVLGGGIASMHYVGMAAMEMNATITYDVGLTVLSVAVAVVAATVAIWIAFKFTSARSLFQFRLRAAAAVAMGAGICGMHYVGMSAASYVPLVDAVVSESSSTQHSHTWLAVSLGVASLFILGITHLTIFFDYKLTAVREAGAEAAQTAFRLNEILDDSPSEIYVFHADSLDILSANRGAVNNIGYCKDQLETMSIDELCPDIDHACYVETLKPIKERQCQLVEFESAHRRMDGSVYPIHISIQISKATADPVMVAIAADITERRSLEEQIVQARKMESIGQLAAGIAHEINTPAQFVGDNTRFLDDVTRDLFSLIGAYDRFYLSQRDDSAVPAEVEAVAAVIKDVDPNYLREEIPVAIKQTLEGVERISNIVSAMKDFSHPGSRKKELIDINSDIANTIIVASNEWKYVADVKTDYDSSLPKVLCHQQEIKQVILNLIVNAAHAVHDGVEDQPVVEKGEIVISTEHTGELVEVRISDNGCGIPEDIKSRIFDPFFTTKVVGKGTGQGLSIAYSTVVDRHGGEIDVESEVGVGTTFVVRLPIAA